MKKEKFITERTRIISEMLDNPDNYGIYPTTKCFEQLDELFDNVVNGVNKSAEQALPIRDVSVSLQEHKQVIKDLLDTYIINRDDEGNLKASMKELLELSDRAVNLIKQ